MTRRVMMATTVSLMLLALLSVVGTAAQAPEASPVAPGTGGAWQISDVRPLDVDGDVAALSSDGQWLAGINSDGVFCIWGVETLAPTCAGEPLPIRVESIAWAPDSTAVAFSLDGLRRGEDSDLYVFELGTGTLTNLTDDGFDGSIFDMTADHPHDDVPTWSPDSQQIAFARSIMVIGEDTSSTRVMRIDRSGGEPVEILALEAETPALIWMPMAWLPDDTILYTRLSGDMDEPEDGLWKVGIGGGEPALMVPGSEEADIPAPEIVDVAPEQGLVSIHSRLLAGRGVNPETQPVAWMLDLSSGEVTPVPRALTIAGVSMFPSTPAVFSPDGSVALLLYLSGPDPQVVIMDTATAELNVVDAPGRDALTLFTVMMWVENGTMLADTPEGAMLITLERIS